MLLCVDIGNTNITLGGYREDTLVFTARLASDVQRTADQYAVELYDILRLNGCSAAQVQGAILSSVVPTLTDALCRASQKLFGFAPMVLGPGVKSGLNIKIDNPAQLGADLVAGAIGAMAKFPLPCIIIDLGTATTISVLNAKGEFLGGAIAAGIRLTLEALTKNTAQLPLVGIEAPKSVIGSNTIDCMKSGLILGAAAMLDGLVERIEAELGHKSTLIATGGLAQFITPLCKREIILEKDLLLKGLNVIYKKNKR